MTPTSVPAPSTVDGIETELLMLSRWLEAVQRRQDYPMDRAAYVLLRRLAAHGPQRVAELASALGLDGSTVTRQLTALDRAGHIARRRHPDDARATVVEATPEGLAAMESLRGYRQERIAGHFADWTPGEQDQLYDVLHRLNTVLRHVALDD
ncbi:MAG: MarR family winged helix-turn-helix transcriptional regulator [Actinomycetes bacterium]